MYRFLFIPHTRSRCALCAFLRGILDTKVGARLTEPRLSWRGEWRVKESGWKDCEALPRYSHEVSVPYHFLDFSEAAL